jgi:hypothetical protein
VSASYIRAKFRTWATEVAAATGLPFYDTINRQQNPADAVWWTCGFTSEFHEGTFCDRGYIETGFVTVIVVAEPGLGDLPAVQAMEQIVPALDAKIDPTQRLVLESYEPIDEQTAGSADQNYRVRCNINYRHSL